MNWLKHSDWAIVSDCGRYSVSKARSGTNGERVAYTPWLRGTKGRDGRPPQQIGPDVATAAEARAVCERHAQEPARA